LKGTAAAPEGKGVKSLKALMIMGELAAEVTEDDTKKTNKAKVTPFLW
jgi:hypothetical protein